MNICVYKFKIILEILSGLANATYLPSISSGDCENLGIHEYDLEFLSG